MKKFKAVILPCVIALFILGSAGCKTAGDTLQGACYGAAFGAIIDGPNSTSMRRGAARSAAVGGSVSLLGSILDRLSDKP